MPDRRVVVTYRRGTRPCRWNLPLRTDGRIKKSDVCPRRWAGEKVETVVEWLRWIGATDITITQEANP